MRRRPSRQASRSASPRKKWVPKLKEVVKEEVKEELPDNPEMEAASSRAEDKTLEARPRSRRGRRTAKGVPYAD